MLLELDSSFLVHEDQIRPAIINAAIAVVNSPTVRPFSLDAMLEFCFGVI